MTASFVNYYTDGVQIIMEDYAYYNAESLKTYTSS